jgi:hypothetical protein
VKPQEDRPAVGLVERQHQLREQPFGLMLGQQLFGRRGGVHGTPLRLARLRSSVMPRARPHQVAHDGGDPGAERAVARGGQSQGAQPRLLHDIVGLVPVAQHPPRQAPHPFGVSQQIVQGGLIVPHPVAHER